MKVYVLSVAVGVLVGVIYGLLNVRSPAPPIIALLGLLGILLGEQIPSFVRQLIKDDTHEVGWFDSQVKPHLFGKLPQGQQKPIDAEVKGKDSPLC